MFLQKGKNKEIFPQLEGGGLLANNRAHELPNGAIQGKAEDDVHK